jgi:hypothetical protein
MTYRWSPGGATTAAITVTPSSTVTYSVTTTDLRGCTASASATITVTSINAGTIVPTSGSTPISFCSGSAQRAMQVTGSSGGSGQFQYQWQQSADNISFTDITSATL